MYIAYGMQAGRPSLSTISQISVHEWCPFMKPDYPTHRPFNSRCSLSNVLRLAPHCPKLENLNSVDQPQPPPTVDLFRRKCAPQPRVIFFS